MSSEHPAEAKAAEAPTADAARWERRSADRVLEGSRERVLERSRRIVRAASELVAEQGFEAVTLRAVLERTGLSRRAFYDRFDGKDELLLAVFEETFRLAAEQLRERIASEDDPLERLRLLLDQMIRGAHAADGAKVSIAMSREHLRLADSQPRELRQALEPLTRLMAEQLAEGMERGQVRPADPYELAVMVHNLVSATVHTELLGSTGESNPEQTSATVWEFCRRAVRA